jgi:hypothetical protein
MITQLLWLHLLLFGGFAALLLIAPTLSIRTLGLPAAEPSFWPRVCGALMGGIAFAIAAVGLNWTSTGIGLGGAIAIDVTLAVTLLSTLVIGPTAPTRRGRLLLWVLVLALVALALVSVAYAR